MECPYCKHESYSGFARCQNKACGRVLPDYAGHDAMQESLALLSMLARSSKSVREGRCKPVRTAFRDLATKIKSLK
jgi:hypothetical protein